MRRRLTKEDIILGVKSIRSAKILVTNRRTGKGVVNWEDEERNQNNIEMSNYNPHIPFSHNKLYWKLAVLARDKYLCQHTGKRAHNVHRINTIHEGNLLSLKVAWEVKAIEDFYNPLNGIALHHTAHKEFHDKYGYGNNNLAQIEEFLGRPLPEEQRDFLLSYEKYLRIDETNT